MSAKHLLAILATSVYLLIVGFADFNHTDPRPVAQEQEVAHGVVLRDAPKPTQQPQQPKPVTPPPKPVHEEHSEREKAAKAISHLYPHVSHRRAMQVVSSVYDHSKTYGLKPSVVLAVMATESSFNRDARSAKGAIGYLQVIPKYHRKKIRGRNLQETDVNVQVGAEVLKECYAKHRSDRKALACYNGATTKQKANAYYKSVIKHQYVLKRAITKLG